MSAQPLTGELVHMPAGQAALLDDPAKLAALSDAEFRVWSSEVLSAAKRYLAPLSHPVGIMLAEANRRYSKADYTSFVEECEKAIGVSRSTLWRWRSHGEKALGIAPERPKPVAPARQERPPISPKAEASISAPIVAEPHSEPPPSPSPPGAIGVGPATPLSGEDAATREGADGVCVAASTPSPAPSPDRRHGAQGEPGDGASSALHETAAPAGVPCSVAEVNAWLLTAGRIPPDLLDAADSIALNACRRALEASQQRRDTRVREQGPLARRSVEPQWKKAVKTR